MTDDWNVLVPLGKYELRTFTVIYDRRALFCMETFFFCANLPAVKYS